jgi:hypothetical protein
MHNIVFVLKFVDTQRKKKHIVCAEIKCNKSGEEWKKYHHRLRERRSMSDSPESEAMDGGHVMEFLHDLKKKVIDYLENNMGPQEFFNMKDDLKKYVVVEMDHHSECKKINKDLIEGKKFTPEETERGLLHKYSFKKEYVMHCLKVKLVRGSPSDCYEMFGYSVTNRNLVFTATHGDSGIELNKIADFVVSGETKESSYGSYRPSMRGDLGFGEPFGTTTESTSFGTTSAHQSGGNIAKNKGDDVNDYDNEYDDGTNEDYKYKYYKYKAKLRDLKQKMTQKN